jgi:hypothetical protein
MKRIAAFLLLLAMASAWSVPAWSMPSKPENRSIGENGREARRAAKKYHKSSQRSGRKQQRQMKKYQKAQHKLAKRAARRRTR